MENKMTIMTIIINQLNNIQNTLGLLIRLTQAKSELDELKGKEVEASSNPLNHEANFSGEDSAQSSESDIF